MIDININGTKFKVEVEHAMYMGTLNEETVLARLREHAAIHFTDEREQQALTFALAKLEIADNLDVVSVTKMLDWNAYIGCTVQHRETGVIAIVASYNPEENHLGMTDMSISHASQWKPISVVKDLTGCLVEGKDSQGLKIVKEHTVYDLYFTDHTSGAEWDYSYVKKLS